MSRLGSLSRRLVPIPTGGGGGSGSTPLGLPIVTPPIPAGGVWYWDDFYQFSAAPVAALAAAATIPTWVSGLVATPATIANQAAYGHPPWRVTAIGTAGAGSCGISTGNNAAAGLCALVSGATSGDGLLMESGGRTTTAATHMFFGHSTLDAIAMWRLALSQNTTVIQGFGWCSVLAAGTDWLTDPDTAFAAANAVVFHRDSSGTGDLNLRVYENSGVGNSVTQILASASIGTSYRKYELRSSAGQLQVWYQDYAGGAGLVATVTMPTSWLASGVHMRVTTGVKTLAASSRQLTFDTYMQCVATNPGTGFTSR